MGPPRALLVPTVGVVRRKIRSANGIEEGVKLPPVVHRLGGRAIVNRLSLTIGVLDRQAIGAGVPAVRVLEQPPTVPAPPIEGEGEKVAVAALELVVRRRVIVLNICSATRARVSPYAAWRSASSFSAARAPAL